MGEAQKIIRTLTGKVVSNKMDKTVTVLVPRSVKHPLIGKVTRLSSTFHDHDEKTELGEGDMVEITESKQLSKRKT